MPNQNQMVKGERRGGRQKGTPNKVTRVLKEAILLAGEQAGNRIGNEGLVSYLQHQAEENQVAFMGLLGKVLPLQVAGSQDGPVNVVIRRFGDTEPKDRSGE